MKTRSLDITGEGMMDMELSNSHSHGELSLFEQSCRQVNSSDLRYCYIWPESEPALSEKPYLQGIKKKYIGNCLTLQLPKAAVQVGANKELTKKPEKKNWRKMSIRVKSTEMFLGI